MYNLLVLACISLYFILCVVIGLFLTMRQLILNRLVVQNRPFSRENLVLFIYFWFVKCGIYMLFIER